MPNAPATALVSLAALGLTAGCLEIERATTPASDVVSESCLSEGALRCDEGDLQHCEGGSWQELVRCPDGYACEDNACRCIKGSCAGRECGSDGCGNSCGSCGPELACTDAGRCVEIGSCVPSCDAKTCGGDGCGGSCGTCGADQACVDGACGEGLSCRDAANCIAQCLKTGRGDQDSCTTTCLGQATSSAYLKYIVYLGCISENACRSYYCIAERCASDYASCLFEGQGQQTCGGILLCQQTCDPSDLECAAECGDAGTPTAQTDYVALLLCITEACGTTPDPQCGAAAATGVCQPFATSCGVAVTSPP